MKVTATHKEAAIKLNHMKWRQLLEGSTAYLDYLSNHFSHVSVSCSTRVEYFYSTDFTKRDFELPSSGLIESVEASDPWSDIGVFYLRWDASTGLEKMPKRWEVTLEWIKKERMSYRGYKPRSDLLPLSFLLSDVGAGYLCYGKDGGPNKNKLDGAIEKGGSPIRSLIKSWHKLYLDSEVMRAKELWIDRNSHINEFGMNWDRIEPYKLTPQAHELAEKRMQIAWAIWYSEKKMNPKKEISTRVWLEVLNTLSDERIFD